MPVKAIDYETFSDGDKIPSLGLGTWLSNDSTAIDAVKCALTLGYRHIDTAWLYGNEKEIGEAVREFIANSNGAVKRSDLFITTKLWNTFRSKEQVRVGFEKSFNALNLDYIDLYLIHWPTAYKEGTDDQSPVDPETGRVAFSDVDYVETFKAMGELKKEGKVKHLGVSNFTLDQLKRLERECPEVAIEAHQLEAHPLLAQTELNQYCQHKGILVQAYAPLGAPYAREPGEIILLDHEVVKDIAKKHQKTPAQVLIRWCLQKGYNTIAKSANPKRLEENLRSKDSIELDDDDMKKLDALDASVRFNWLHEMAGHKLDPFKHERKQLR
ncbi:hypothetical protein ACOME3_006749 [Neoechinorhynchus agilis]